MEEIQVQGFEFDMSKPLGFQVGHLGASYQEWVHQPVLTSGSPRYFESDLCEMLTKTPWWIVPIVWLPVVGWCLFKSISFGCSVSSVFSFANLGVFMWTLMEYALHRFVFHVKTTSYWGNTAHFLTHGCHHKHPMDHLRLNISPVIVAVVAFMIWNLMKMFTSPSTRPALFGGILFGYIIYDVTHFHLHHGQTSIKIWRSLKKYHMNHHFRIQNKGFGVVRTFGTRFSEL